MMIFLPVFYQEFKGKQKWELEHVLIQYKVDQSAKFFDVLPFKVHPSQVKSFRAFDFAGLSMPEVGTGVLPLHIIPLESISLDAAWVLATNHAQAETYDISGEPPLGALYTSDKQRLRNKMGYLHVSWTEAHCQI
jgi:hypothetical protein